MLALSALPPIELRDVAASAGGTEPEAANGHCALRPGEFVHTLGDAHLYLNHIEQAKLQISRAPRRLPTMTLNSEVRDLFAFRFEDFALEGYDPHPAIKAPVAI